MPACNAAAGGTRTNMLCQGIRDSKGQARRARARAFNMAFRGQRGVRWRKAWQRPVDKGGMRERTPCARAAPAARDSMCERGARRGKAWGGDRRVAGRLGVDLGQFAFVTHNAARGDELVRCARQLSPEAVRPQSDLGVIWGSLSVGQRFGWRLSLRRSRDMVGATGEHIGWHDKCVWSSGGGGGGEHPAG